MGIPLFFKIISDKYDNIIHQTIDNSNNNSIFFDLNCLIHPCAQRIVKNYYHKNKDILENKIYNEVILYTKKIISLVNPSFVYIAIDGVAPFAKMNQQRQRRFKSVLEKQQIKEIKSDLNLEPDNEWDSNAISPGTEFMNKLIEKINTFIQNDDIFKQKEVIFSSSNICGEGEHKILQYIKDNEIKDNIIIYGLDADLIMLSMICVKSNIYLLREKMINGKPVDDNYIYVNIDNLKINLLKDFEERYYDKHNNYTFQYNYNIIHDYIFICFFLGNDFIPHILSLDLRYQGLDIIMDIYIYIHKLTNEHFVQDGKINMYFLKLFLQKLSEKEDEVTTLVFKKRINYNKYFKIKADNDYDKRIELLNNKPIIEMEKEFLITKEKFHVTHWKYNYYKHCFDIDTKNEIDEICKNYIEGIFWTFEYYFNKCSSWRWKYQYNYAPTLSDLYKYICKNPDYIKIKHETPVKPIVQLLFILPKKSKSILPIKYQKYMTDFDLGLTHLYPESYELSCLFKRYYWQCTPILPCIDNTLIQLIK